MMDRNQSTDPLTHLPVLAEFGFAVPARCQASGSAWRTTKSVNVDELKLRED
jgi:hypothetical protein